MTEYYIIKKGTLFWSGLSWTPEYPDAKIYYDYAEAHNIATMLFATLYVNYGEED